MSKKIYPKSISKELFIKIINFFYDNENLNELNRLIQMRAYCLSNNIDVSPFLKIKTKKVLDVVKKDIEFLSNVSSTDLFNFKSYIISYFDYLKPVYSNEREEYILQSLVETSNKNIFPFGTDNKTCYLFNVEMIYKIKNPDYSNIEEVETVYNNWIKNNSTNNNSFQPNKKD